MIQFFCIALNFLVRVKFLGQLHFPYWTTLYRAEAHNSEDQPELKALRNMLCIPSIHITTLKAKGVVLKRCFASWPSPQLHTCKSQRKQLCIVYRSRQRWRHVFRISWWNSHLLSVTGQQQQHHWRTQCSRDWEAGQGGKLLSRLLRSSKDLCMTVALSEHQSITLLKPQLTQE